jgi:hypothetical protein
MAFPTIGVLDKDSAPQTVNTLPNAGQNTKANSLGVNLASDDDLVVAIGAKADTSATSDGGTFSLIALFKRALGYLSTIATNAASTADSPVESHQPCDMVPFTPTLDTFAYSVGDILFTAQTAALMRVNDGRCRLESITIADKDDQKAGIRLLFFKTNVAFGTINAAPSISDTDSVSYMGHVDFATGDYVDLGGASVVSMTPSAGAGWRVGLLEAATGTTNVFVVGMVIAGTPTFSANGLVVGFGSVQS